MSEYTNLIHAYFFLISKYTSTQISIIPILWKCFIIINFITRLNQINCLLPTSHNDLEMKHDLFVRPE